MTAQNVKFVAKDSNGKTFISTSPAEFWVNDEGKLVMEVSDWDHDASDSEDIELIGVGMDMSQMQV